MLSRKDFLTGTAALATGVTVCSPALAEGDASFGDSIKWDAAYDVVVVGFGDAGAATSITAAENGAKVLLAEKAIKGLGGGNSRVCAQSCYAPWTLRPPRPTSSPSSPTSPQ